MKITKSQLKQIIKEALTGITYGPEGDEGAMKRMASKYSDEGPLDPDKAAELEAVFAGDEELTDEEQRIWDDMQRAEDLEKMYADGRTPGWLEQMGFWPAGGLEENNMKITKLQLKQIIKEELESVIQERTLQDSMIEKIVSAFQSMHMGANNLKVQLGSLAGQAEKYGFNRGLVNNALTKVEEIYTQVEESSRLNNAVIEDYKKRQK